MAGREHLSCLQKRDLLNQAAVSVETLMHWGRIHEEAGLVFDALDFYEKGNLTEALERLLKSAVESGDTFLFNRACRALKREAGRDEWLDVAGRARYLGKDSLAEQALRLAGGREGTE